jgi:hypothetical protein
MNQLITNLVSPEDSEALPKSLVVPWCWLCPTGLAAKRSPQKGTAPALAAPWRRKRSDPRISWKKRQVDIGEPENKWNVFIVFHFLTLNVARGHVVYKTFYGKPG